VRGQSGPVAVQRSEKHGRSGSVCVWVASGGREREACQPEDRNP
jgi:hypothetical protein